MEQLRVENVFQANKVCYFLSKIFNFVSITIEESGNNFNAYTSKFDILKFIFGLFFSCFSLYDILRTPLHPENRSIIFEILISLNGKMQGVHSIISMIQSFYYRYEYFNIFNSLYWIDTKVKFNFQLKLKNYS